ncbi:type III polyketide synthase [Aurantibacillus circumpalustris]|uniref:type III polyketide synthase n=1 Tax=Aurantibacillus circumpalustris TaxID=3036359 RepID=UPI00295ABFC2|nr:type III polyketide synthase [Aurantibacillus circumpalustris]
MSYLVAIGTAVPEYLHKKEAIMRFFQNSTKDEKTKRKIKIVSEKSGIETRYSVIPDFSLEPKKFNFFEKTALLEPEPGLSKRMAIFKKEALKLSLKAVHAIPDFKNVQKNITHIITVTCTGLFAPGLDVELIKELNLSPSTVRSSVNFMGCNAAIMAMHSAHTICESNRNANVLVVCTELCTIHFRKIYNDDYVLSTSLFGDGSAAVILSAQKPKEPFFEGIKIDGFHSQIIHKGASEMAWQLSEKGFIMNLSSYVSELISGSLKPLLKSVNIDPKKISLWAVHPGGKKILDDFAKVLKLNDSELADSYETLKNYGNMSSVTVLFVLKRVLENNRMAKKGTKLFSAAFGPGLSIEAMLLKYV